MGIKATIVLDTCAILGCLSLIKELEKDALAHDTELLVPREVIRELDAIKDRRAGGNREARKAIKWISEELKRQHGAELVSLRGQKASETSNPHLKKDDAILECAVYNKQAYKRLTIMFSCDHNLCNRAIIDGLETLEAPTPSVTKSVIYEAIERKTSNEMDLDDLSQTPHWSPPPDQHLQPSLSPLPTPSELPENDLDMEDDIDSPPPPAPKPMPAPIKEPGMQEFVMHSLSKLIDWRLHTMYSDEELDYLKYKTPPDSSKQMARVIKQFQTPLAALIPSKILQEFIDAAYSQKTDKKFIMAHVRLLQALSGYSTEYEEIITSYFA